MAVFLAGYQTGSRKHRDKSGTRQYCHLPQPAWFIDRIQTYGDMTQLSIQGSTARPPQISTATVVGLAQLGPGCIFSGRLTPFDLEADLLWRYWDKPQACYSVEILQFYSLKEPITIHARKPVEGWRGENRDFKVDLSNWIFFPASEIRVDDLFGEECLPQGLPEPADIPILWLPEAILTLVQRGVWKPLLLHFSRSEKRSADKVAAVLNVLQGIMNWPSQREMQALWDVRYKFSEAPVKPLKEQAAQFLLQQIRQHSDVLISDGGAVDNVDDLMERQFLLEQAEEGLQLMLEAESQPRHICKQNSLRRQPLSDKLIIDCIRAARHLRNRGHLKLMRDAVIEALMPQHFQSFARSVMFEPPSSSSISRYQARFRYHKKLGWSVDFQEAFKIF